MSLDEIITTKYPNYRYEKFYAGGKDVCGYFPLYERHLPKTVEDFMEIGIAMGISIKMFRDYYESGNFHAMNMHWGSAGVINKKELQQEGFICHEGDQSDLKFLDGIKTQYDVIIDDGSHRSDHQIITFKQMFLNNIKPGGLYIIEDMHCCQEAYWWGDIKRFEDTILYVLGSYSKTEQNDLTNLFKAPHGPFGQSNSLQSQMITGEESEEILSKIKRIVIYDPSIAFIYA